MKPEGTLRPQEHPFRLQLEPRQNALVVMLLAGLLATLAYSLAKGLGLDQSLLLLMSLSALGALLGVAGSHRPVPVLVSLAVLATLGTGALFLPLPPLATWRWELGAGFDLLWASTGQGAPPPGMLVAETAATGVLLFAGGVALGWVLGWAVWRRAWTLPALLAGLLVLGAQWLWYVEAARPATVAYWLLWLPLAGVVTAGARQSTWVQSGSRLARPPTELSVLISVALALAVTFVAVSIPGNFKPVNLDAISHVITDALPRLEGLRGASAAGGAKNRFTLARTGFARSQEKLGGPVRTDQREALQVRVTAPDTPETLYLRGSIDTQYTGQGWRTPPEVKGDGAVLTNPIRLVPEVPFASDIIPAAQWVPGVSGGLPTRPGEQGQQAGKPASVKLVVGPGAVTTLEIDPKSVVPGVPAIIDPDSLPPDATVQIEQQNLPPGTKVRLGDLELPPGVRVQVDLAGFRSSSTQAAQRAQLLRLPGTNAAISVTPSDLRSSSIFVPTGVLQVTVPDGTAHRDLVGNLTTDKSLPKHQSYTEQAELIVTPGDVLQHFAAGKGPDLAPYLALPQDLPPRVGSLAREVTTGARSDYERALAIEAYLRSLRYTLDAPTPPAGRDFVDYFLFDLKSGYCTYSSTAMAVMLRTIGIPSRWVQGFAVPLDKGMGSYSVRNDQAHAWVEAYFEGYGWVLFDPTPRLTMPDRTAVVRPDTEPGTAGGGTGGGSGTGISPGRRPLEDDPEATDTPAGALTPINQPFPWGRLLRDILLTLAALCLVGLAALAAALWWRERVPASSQQNQLRALFRNLEGMLGRFGHGRGPGQTPAEWFQALRLHWPDLAGELQLALAAYEAARYGRQDPSVGAVGRTAALWNELCRRVRREAGLSRYVWGRLRPPSQAGRDAGGKTPARRNGRAAKEQSAVL